MKICCGGRYWCPTVEYNGKVVSIEDDFGGKVQLSTESWNKLIEKVEKGTLKKIKK